MTDDGPSLSEYIHGVVDRTSKQDLWVVIFIVIVATGYAIYQGMSYWWLLPPLMIGLIFTVEAALWHFYDYRQAVLREKERRIAEGQDIDPAIDDGPGLLDPLTLALFASVSVWALMSLYIFMPSLGRFRGFYVFSAGMIIIAAVLPWAFNRQD